MIQEKTLKVKIKRVAFCSIYLIILAQLVIGHIIGNWSTSSLEPGFAICTVVAWKFVRHSDFNRKYLWELVFFAYGTFSTVLEIIVILEKYNFTTNQLTAEASVGVANKISVLMVFIYSALVPVIDYLYSRKDSSPIKGPPVTKSRIQGEVLKEE